MLWDYIVFDLPPPNACIILSEMARIQYLVSEETKKKTPEDFVEKREDKVRSTNRTLILEMVGPVQEIENILLRQEQ